MEILMSVFLLLLGLVIIIKAGDLFVDSASWMAEASGIPKLIVGATVVSIATTLPELLVSLFAALDANATGDLSYVDMAVGNAVGSVTANTGLILAIALVCIPAAIKRKDYLLKTVLLLGSALVITAFSLMNNGIGLIPSVILFVIFAVAMGENIYVAVKTTKSEINDEKETEQIDKSKKTVVTNIIKFVLGALGIVLGAELLKSNGQSLAELCGVPTRIVSLTIIAIGTSLPELVTTVTAIAKKEASLSAGNIIGANIIDLTLILPICAIVSGGVLPVTESFATFDIPACLIISTVALIPTLITKKFTKLQGVIMLGLYITYLVISCFFL